MPNATFGAGGLTAVIVHDPGGDIDDAVANAVGELGGRRGVVYLPWGSLTVAAAIDVKRAVIVGQGVPGTSGGGGTTVNFATGGFFSSVNENYGYELRDLYIKGSGGSTPSKNGQTLVDFTGQNYPRLSSVRIGHAETGILLANGASVECHYGAFYNVNVDKCFRAAQVDALANSHQFFGGRWWANPTQAYIDANNIAFHGTSFEAHTTGIDSGGSNVSTFGCRFEGAVGAHNLAQHGTPGDHYVFGDHWSTGIDPTDPTYAGPANVFGFAKGQLLQAT